MLDAQVVVQLDLVFCSKSAKQAVELLIGVTLVMLIILFGKSDQLELENLSTLTSSSKDVPANGQSWQENTSNMGWSTLRWSLKASTL
jgi:hypothetical protein